MSLHVDELIYARLETDVSPTSSQGNQVALASPGLSAAERGQLESLLMQYGDRARRRSRLRYVRLQSGRIAIVRGTLLEGETRVVDREGRAGWVSHALIVNPSDFADIGSDPFMLLDGAWAVTTAPELEARVKVGATLSRVAAPSLGSLPADDPFNPEFRTRLARWACRAEAARRQGRRLCISSSPRGVDLMLRTALCMAPASSRQECTFDTLADGATSTGLYWATAYENPESVEGVATNPDEQLIPAPDFGDSTEYEIALCQSLAAGLPTSEAVRRTHDRLAERAVAAQAAAPTRAVEPGVASNAGAGARRAMLTASRWGWAAGWGLGWSLGWMFIGIVAKPVVPETPSTAPQADRVPPPGAGDPENVRAQQPNGPTKQRPTDGHDQGDIHHEANVPILFDPV